MTLFAQVKKRRDGFEIDVAIEAKRSLVLVGPNGAGKTTTLLMLLGIVRPDEGSVRLGDTVLFDHRRGVNVAPELRNIGYLPQDAALFPHLTALENVAFGPRALGRSASDARRIAIGVMEEVQLSALATRTAAHLSGGERHKVALARALAAQPRALVLDEPLGPLDLEARQAARAFLRDRLAAFPGPSVVVLHDPRDAAALDAPLAVIEAGRIVQTGTPEEIRADPRSDYARRFTQEET